MAVQVQCLYRRHSVWLLLMFSITSAVHSEAQHIIRKLRNLAGLGVTKSLLSGMRTRLRLQRDSFDCMVVFTVCVDSWSLFFSWSVAFALVNG